MARQYSLPENFKIVQLQWPTTTNATITSDTVCLKNAHKAWIVCEFIQAVGHATTPTLNQATDVASATNAAGPTSQIWANEDVAASDTLVKKTSAASYAVTNDVKKKQVVFEVEPATLTAGYTSVYITIATSSQATNYVSITAYLAMRHQQATPPSAIID